MLILSKDGLASKNSMIVHTIGKKFDEKLQSLTLQLHKLSFIARHALKRKRAKNILTN